MFSNANSNNQWQIASWSDSQISVVIPTLATSGTLSVIAGGQFSNPISFTALPPLDAGHGPIEGMIRDAAGNPFGNAQVAVVGPNLNSVPNVMSDVNGRYAFTNVAPGPFWIQAATGDGIYYATARGNLPDLSSTQEVNLQFPGLGAVEGTITYSDGTPAAFLFPEIQNLDSLGPLGSYVNFYAMTDGSGHFREDIPAGGVVVSVSDDISNGNAVTTRLQLNSGETKTVNLTIDGTAFSFNDPSPTPDNLDGSDGFRYDVGCSGNLITGGSPDRSTIAFQGFQDLGGDTLSLNGTQLTTTFPCLFAAPADLSGRQHTLGPVPIEGVGVTRKVFVPSSGGFARYLEILSNLGTSAVNEDVIIRSSSAAAQFSIVTVAPSDTSSTYGITDSTPSSFSVVVADVFASAGGVPVSATHFVNGDGISSYDWNVVVPAGGTVALMHFLVQRPGGDTADAQLQAQALVNLTDPNALAGMSQSELGEVANFSLVPQPTISAITPVSGPVGTQITITGSSFGTTQGTVTISGTNAIVTSWTDSQILATVAAGTTSGPIVVTQNSISSNSINFTVLLPPSISSLTPSEAAVGSTVRISGFNFGAVPGFVTFNGQQGTISTWSDTSINVLVPAGASSGNVFVINGDGQSNAVLFNLVQPNPLAITATASPLPNAGWNNVPVTVSFTCSGGAAPVTCPPSETISTEGANQVITGTASDSTGSNVSVSLTLNIDETQPTLSLTSPNDGAVVSRPTLRLTGSVSDALSGVASVRCNGAIAVSVDSGSYVCNVPLVAGANPVQVQTVDIAGNSANTAQISVTYAPVAPSAIFISPSLVNMQIGDLHPIALSGEAGQIVSGATWAVADPTVVSLSPTDPPQLTALAAGTTTVTASLSGLQATMTVNVFSDAIPFGTPLWSAQSITGTAINGITPANPINEGDPDVYMIDGQSTLRGFTADGQQLWAIQIATGNANNSTAAQTAVNFIPQRPTGNIPTPTMNNTGLSLNNVALSFRANALYSLQQHALGQRRILDKRLIQVSSAAAAPHTASAMATESLPIGGAGPALLIQTVADNAFNAINVVFSCQPSNCGTFTPAFVAVDNASQSQIWEYDLTDGPYTSIDPIAIAPDNTIYATGVFETGPPNSLGLAPTHSQVVAIDGNSGLPKFTIPVAPSHTTFTLADESGNVLENDDQDDAAAIGPLAVMPDGSVRMLIETVQSLEADLQTNGEAFNNPCGILSRRCATSISNHKTLQLLTIQPDGSSSLQPVRNYDFVGSGCAPCSDPGAQNFFLPGDVIPDSLGGVLAAWTENQEQNGIQNQFHLSAHMRHLDSLGGFTDFAFPDLGLVPPNLAAYQGDSLVLGENGTFFGVGLKLQQVDVDSFGTLWSTPFLSPKSAMVLGGTSDGGLQAAELTAPSGDADALQIFDPLGVVSTFQLSAPISNAATLDATKLVALSAPNGEAIGLPGTSSFDGALPWNQKRGNKPGQRSPNLPKLKINKVIAFIDKDGSSQSEEVPLTGIASGQIEQVRITSDVTSTSPQIKLSLETASKTIGAATFADGTTQTVITPTASHPALVQIKGVTTSSVADNIILTTKVGNTVISRQKFSVVSVKLDLQVSGELATDNSAKDIYLQKITPDQNMGTPNFTGLGAFATNNNSFACEVGVQLVGKVAPSNYRGKIVLRRTLLHSSLYDGPENVLKDDGPPAGNSADDTSDEIGLDSDPQSGGSGGEVYDLDGPGATNVFPSITIRRYRANFSEYAVLDERNNTIPVSDQLPWYARVSCKMDESDPRIISLINDVEGDNQGGKGTTPTSALLN